MVGWSIASIFTEARSTEVNINIIKVVGFPSILPPYNNMQMFMNKIMHIMNMINAAHLYITNGM